MGMQRLLGSGYFVTEKAGRMCLDPASECVGTEIPAGTDLQTALVHSVSSPTAVAILVCLTAPVANAATSGVGPHDKITAATVMSGSRVKCAMPVDQQAWHAEARGRPNPWRTVK